MLRRLSIRDVVLIDRLDLDFAPGLTVLSGETGAGKSILLDCLTLALGARGEAGLVRRGAASASVAAEFELAPTHPIGDLLGEHGLAEAPWQPLRLRRVQGADGKSRAFVNDQPVGVALLRQIGSELLQIEGQFERERLRDGERHRAALDGFGRQGEAQARVAALDQARKQAAAALAQAAAQRSTAAVQAEEIAAALAALDALAPQTDEEPALAEERKLLQNAERLVEALSASNAELDAAEPALRRAGRSLQRIADKSGGRLDGALAALDRATAELAEALSGVRALGHAIDRPEGRLDAVESRLFALRAAARRHAVTVADLPALRATLRATQATLTEDGAAPLARLAGAAEDARRAYAEAAEALSRSRTLAAKRLERAVMAELPPLKLERARFQILLERLPEASWGAQGLDRVGFRIATLPGAEPGAIDAVASGGELSRLLLALRVALAATGEAATLVFDEADAGVGGATAAAVGERLSQLARTRQVLAVTHSPQVAARANQHLRVVKRLAGEIAITEVEALDTPGRREEIARMLSGARVTEEARAAADRLLDGAAA
ncbi:MAG: DNA repair protein RecN [Alphaproteobacteria bacterium]|nr:DNA repair protein RecN [Alphaproteobacteria bacterium]